MVNKETKHRIALLLGCKEQELDNKLLGQAIRAVQFKNNDYWDGMANHGQLDGNVPKYCCIALVYDFLTQ